MDLRYPIGRFERPAAATPELRREWIDTIAAAPARYREAVRGLSDAQLDTAYRPEGWTVRQVIHHVADSHINAYVRTHWVLTEDRPTIKAYDEKGWAELPDATTAPIEVSLALIAATHQRWTLLLQSLPDEAFDRELVHPQNGPMTLDKLVHMYAWHGRHHTGHLQIVAGAA